METIMNGVAGCSTDLVSRVLAYLNRCIQNVAQMRVARVFIRKFYLKYWYYSQFPPKQLP